MLTPAQIKQAAGVREGQNLMTVNLKDVREQLLLLPAISMVTITHDFAGKVTVTPVQRVPVAWVKCEHLHWLPMRVGQGLLVDADGRAIPAETVLPDYGKLPVIVDDTIDQITAGAPIASKRFVAAMDLMKALVERQARDGRMLKSIEVKNKFALVATLSDEFKVTFSYDDIGPELKHYDQFMASARGHQWKLSTLNLAADLNIPVTFQVAEASEPPPAIPVSSASSSRSRVSNNASNSATGRSRSNGKSKSTNH
jgi:cell division septal protein FtsQ